MPTWLPRFNFHFSIFILKNAGVNKITTVKHSNRPINISSEHTNLAESVKWA